MEMGTASGEARLSASVPRGKGVTTADKYRRRAQACLIAASSASTEEGRAGLIELAKTWLRLAQEQEQGSTNIDFVPLSAGKDSAGRPAATASPACGRSSTDGQRRRSKRA